MRESTWGVRIASDGATPFSVELSVWASAAVARQSSPAVRVMMATLNVDLILAATLKTTASLFSTGC
jgi:hypothetical protein